MYLVSSYSGVLLLRSWCARIELLRNQTELDLKGAGLLELPVCLGQLKFVEYELARVPEGRNGGCIPVLLEGAAEYGVAKHWHALLG
jgi:hypothetical protein